MNRNILAQCRRGIDLKTIILICFLCLGITFQAMAQSKETVGFKLDKSVMAEAYWEQWNDSLQNQIDVNIEKYRKANALVKIEGVKKGTEVEVTQLTHDFGFGANIFNFDQLGSDELNAKYKNVFGTLLNSATIAFYWKTFEPEPGKPRYKASYEDSAEFWNKLDKPWKEYHWRRPSPEKVIEFCEEKNIEMHGHPIIWGSKWNHPTWISKDADKVDEMERLFNKRIKEITNFYKDRIPSWDVVNESVEPNPSQKLRYGVMPEDYTFKSFKLAEKEFPESVTFCINDSWRDVYPPFIKGLIERDAKIDIVGLQMHIFDSGSCRAISEGKTVFPNRTSWKPEDVIAYLQTLDSLGRPIHLSEITIQAPGDTPADEQIQAIIAWNMYRLWFSWPSIYKITWWNLVDDCGAAGEPTKSGIFTRQMKPKPAFFALNDLINRKWRTNLTIKLDQNGRAEFSGFRGKYQLKWMDEEGQEKTAEFYLKNDGDGLYSE